MNSRYCSGMSSLPSFSTDRLITCQVTSTGRTFSTSRIQRDVIHAHGQIGSNQKSTRVVSCCVGSCWVMRAPYRVHLVTEYIWPYPRQRGLVSDNPTAGP